MPENNNPNVLVDAVIKFDINKIRAFLRLHVNDNGKPLDINMIQELVQQAGIIYGLDKNVIDDIVNHPLFDKDIEIARGKEPINGEDGKIQYLITHNSFIPKVLPDGRVDYQDLGIVRNVKKGDVLAKILSPTEGINGIDVLGKEIIAKNGRQIIPPLGKNVSLNGNTIVSEVDGQPALVNDKINVYPVFEVKGDIDYSIGNIDFIGSIHVHGNINMGFKIKAKGDVIVEGIMDSSILICEGNVIIKKGIQGEGKGLVKCSGDLTTKYIENSDIEVGGSIYCEAILYSKVMCDGGIYMKGKRGVIINSTIKVKNEVIANNIGSPMYTPTEIEVGFDPEIKTKIMNIKNQIDHLKKELLKLNKIISYFRQLDVNSIDINRKAIYEKSLLTQQNIEQQLIDLNETLQKLNNEMDVFEKANIKVNGILYQGVKITIGNSTMYTHQEYHHVILREEKGQIIFMPI
ncbi:MAG: FapA family protein [Thermoanaerobacteraceae bacterium]|nr:FapA family protein [Thermoanaerobacteraceae bacterium]